MTRPSFLRYGDLGLVVGFVALVTVTLLSVAVPDPLRWVVGIPFLLVVPGYALVSALFPAAPDRESSRTDRDLATGPGWPVRAALSLALSVVVVATLGVALDGIWGIHHASAVVGVSAVTVACAIVAAVRRRPLASEQCASPLRDGLGLSPGAWGQGPIQTAVTVLALVALVSAVAFASAAPADGASNSEFYVLSEGDDGELVADGYPSTFTAGEGHPLHFGIENHEGETVTYDVVVLAQPNGSATDAQQVDRFETRLDDGERALVERTIAPTTVANETRLQILLFEDGVPTEPSADTADESLQVWTDVVASD